MAQVTNHSTQDIHNDNIHATDLHGNEAAFDTHAGEQHHGSDTHGEVSHEVTIFAEPLFNIGNFTVTNSLVNSWIAVFILIVFSVAVRNKIKKVPSGIQNFFEIIVEGGLKLADTVTGDREKSVKVFPFVLSLFLFILVNNYLGLVPGIGSVGMIAMHDGHMAFIPYFRGATADLNTTLAFGAMAVILANLFGIISIGVWNFMNKFVNLKALGHPFSHFPHNLKKDGLFKAIANFFVELLVGLVEFAVGLIEIVGEIAKVASLSFRLFGNIFAGEVLLASVAVIFAFVLPIPFMFLEVIVGLVQALVFSILTLVYFTIASMEHDH